jgi:hypothetical protein
MATRKLICTDNRIIGQAPSDMRIVRWAAATDAEGLTMNADVAGLVYIWRLDPATDVSAWPVGAFRYVTDSDVP